MIFAYLRSNCLTFYSKIESTVLPPGCKPYGLEAGPEFFILVIHKAQVEAATLNKGLSMLVAAGFIPAFKTLNWLNWRG